MRRSQAVIVATCFAMVACSAADGGDGSGTGDTPDSGARPDTGAHHDGGTSSDAGSHDGSTGDSGDDDSGSGDDTGSPDSADDTGAMDTGAADSNTQDAGTPDSSTPDSSTPDASHPPDAGADSGVDAGHDSGVDSGVDSGTDSGGPTCAGTTAHAFGCHIFPYPSDVLHPTGSQSSLDKTTEQAYDTWKAKYVKQGCGGYYVLSGGGTGTNVGDEVSEGHGYGMVITAMMAGYDPNAKTIFDGMYAFFHKFPTQTHANLMSWTVDVAGGCKVPSGGNDSATDGDLDVAFALLLADKQWPGAGYLAKAAAVIADLKSGDMHATTHEPLLGDWASAGDPQYNATRPSDFMLDHFRAFGKATGDASWTQAVDNVYQLITTIQAGYSPNTGLLPDFVINTTATPKPAPANFLEDVTDGQYAYNSCRVPWRIGTDYIASGDARAKAALAKMNSWIMSNTGKDPSKILDGYTLSGGKGSGQSGPSSAFSSPFAVAAMVGTDQAWLDKLWTSRQINEDYYGDSITMLDMIVLSGNWWAP